MKPSRMTSQQIRSKISQLQHIQKTQPSSYTEQWLACSVILNQLFDEMRLRASQEVHS